MFYKELNGVWYTGKTIFRPTGEELNETNKLELDGWKWYDEAPQEYLDWKTQKDFEHFKMLEDTEQ